MDRNATEADSRRVVLRPFVPGFPDDADVGQSNAAGR